jgi:predicted ATPase/class 3 adenylate cyclase/DNA-binding CsgD family transcriptional regulator
MAEPEQAVTDLSAFRARARTEAQPGSSGHPPGRVETEEAGTPPLPAGTVTFLLTDIEGSTRAWVAQGASMAAAVARHYEILDAAITGHGGVRPIEQGEGDSLVAAFARASDAVAAALEAQRALLEESWPGGAEIAVRMALHTGEAGLRDERYYFGPTIIRCARLRALAHGGQVLISNTTADLLADGLPAGTALVPLGVHRLRDLHRPERVFQLSHPALPVDFPPLRSLDVLPNNLPTQLTSFVGWEAELAELCPLVSEHRVVTLVGAGGCGKTRLAAQVAADVAGAYPDGIWWVELALVSDSDLVPRAVMSALGLGDTRGLDPLAGIAGYVGDDRMLLVVDNCEHVLAATAALLDALLRACPCLVALATSREPLGVGGEVVWRVPPLSLPPTDEESAEVMLASEAVRLFVDRALDARPGFRVDRDNASTVGAICARLDGIPLAIELAAARVRALSPQRILDGLADRFRLLTGGARTSVARQQTLEASVQWSHDLLSDPERVLFRRLAAFSGGFSLEAAENIAAGDPLESWEVLTLLSDLVDKSLVVFDGDRYRLLQTVRDFAAGKLDEAGEARSVRDRHAGFFLGVAESAADRIASAPRAETLAALEGDHDNLRAALQWVLATGDGERALRFVVALTLFWKIHGHYSEGEAWCRRALGAVPPDSSPLRARALWALGHLSLYGMELGAGYGMADTERAATLARQLGDPGLLARPLADQGVIGIFTAPDAGIVTLEQTLQAAREAGDGWALASALGCLAFLWTWDRDRPDLARPYLDELHAMASRSQDDYWPVWSDMCVGITAWHEGRLADARQALEAAHARSYVVGDPHLEHWCVAWLSDVLIAAGEYEEARALVARSLDWQRRSAASRSEVVQIYGGRAVLAQGDLAEARRQVEDVTGYLRESGIPFYISQCDAVLGRVALEEGDLAAARSAFRTVWDYGDQFVSPWALVEAHNLQGRLARAEGDPAAAEERHHRALALCVQYGFRGMAAESLEALAALAAVGESHAEAARLFGAAQALRESTGQRRWPLDQPAYDADTAAVRADLGDDAFDQAWKEGAALGLEEAAAYASRARGERKRPSTGWGALTPTELEVVALAAQGLTNAEIGARLFISPGTAKIHLSHIYTKLGVANRAALAAQATARGIGPESRKDSAPRG